METARENEEKEKRQCTKLHRSDSASQESRVLDQAVWENFNLAFLTLAIGVCSLTEFAWGSEDNDLICCT